MSELFNETPLVVNTVLATRIGLNEAIVLQQIHYWLEINKKKNINYIHNKYWTFNSIKEWNKCFPFFGEKTLRRIFLNLEKMGILVTGNFNKMRMDRTKWYTIDYDALDDHISRSTSEDNETENASGQNDRMQVNKMTECKRSKCPNASGQNDQTNTRDYTEITTEITTETTTTPNIQSEIVCASDDAPANAIKQIIDAWNGNKYLRPIIKLTPNTTRYHMLKARLKDYSVQDILYAIHNVSLSDFLQGKTVPKSGRPFLLTFDWFIRPNNFPKILEGYYNNQGATEAEQGSNTYNAFEQLRQEMGGDIIDAQYVRDNN